VTAVAERGFFRGLATTEKHLLGGLSHVLNGAKLAALVGAIAKGLFLAFATAAPKITFPGLNGHDKGGVGDSDWFVIGHRLGSCDGNWERSSGGKMV